MPLPDALRRRLLAAAGAAAVAPWPATTRAQEPFTWPRAQPEALDVAPELAARLAEGVRSGEMANLHAVVLVRRGQLVLEHYAPGQDARWGTPLGRVEHGPTTLHDLRSVSKSVVGLLYGIALAEGRVPDLDTPVLSLFPAYADLAQDPRRRGILVSHLLAMTMGLDWNEDLPYTDPRNSEIAMERSADRYRYVLSQPIVSAPGEKWRYCGGATALLGHLIARGSGMPLLDYAREKLLRPLSIEQAEWTPGTNGEAAAASGLRLRATDLARLGQLVLQDGEWAGRRVVPQAWMQALRTPRAEAFEGVHYGYHWYLARRRDGTLASMAFGLGGQRLVVVPALDLVYVIYMGNYNRPDQLKLVFAVQNAIHAAVR
jgi:CubicO group peptidase (beta-lactamase class C family)